MESAILTPNFEYEIKKRSGPLAEKCQTRNRRMDVTLHSIPIYSTIVKFYHVGPNLKNMSKKNQKEIENEILANDFDISIPYSINKKNRWILADNIGADTLGELIEVNGGVETIILEKQITNYHDAWLLQHTLYHDFMIDGSKCKTLHRFEKYDGTQLPAYEKTTVKGLGQSYSSISQPKNQLKTKNRSEKEKADLIVSYHIFKAPKNFKKVFDKNCNHFCGLGPECFSEREYFVDNKEANSWWIEYDIKDIANHDISNDFDDSSSYYEFEEKLPDSVHNEKCYNFEDHFVERCRQSKGKRQRFVIV